MIKKVISKLLFILGYQISKKYDQKKFKDLYSEYLKNEHVL